MDRFFNLVINVYSRCFRFWEKVMLVEGEVWLPPLLSSHLLSSSSVIVHFLLFSSFFLNFFFYSPLSLISNPFLLLSSLPSTLPPSFLSDTLFISVNVSVTSMPKLGFILNYDNNVKITHTWKCYLSGHACIHWTTEWLRWGESFLLLSKFTLTCVLEDFWTACLLSVATFVSVYLRQ